MCKIMILKGIENSALALKFMTAVAPEMSFMNTDGIGYAAINSENKLFMEKWHRNYQFMNTENVIDTNVLETIKPHIEALKPYFTGVPEPIVNYQSYGEVTRNDLKTVTMHTRFATCDRTFENVHPFIEGETSLIHNGVLTNARELNLNKTSTCDSENALQLFVNDKLNLATSPEQFQQFTDKLKGYWAFGILSKDLNGIYMLDVVRERASLFWTEIPEIGSDCLVFATTKEIIEVGIKELGLEPRKNIFILPESNHNRFNALTGALVDNFIVDESVLNQVYKYPTQYKETKKYSTIFDAHKEKTKLDTTIDEIYEGYRTNKSEKMEARDFINEMQGLNSDEIDVASFYDIEVLLIDRLYDYDKLFGTMYGDAFEDLPVKTKLFIERREEEDYIIFDTILEMIESYVDTDNVKGIFQIYKEQRRA